MGAHGWLSYGALLVAAILFSEFSASDAAVRPPPRAPPERRGGDAPARFLNYAHISGRDMSPPTAHADHPVLAPQVHSRRRGDRSRVELSEYVHVARSLAGLALVCSAHIGASGFVQAPSRARMHVSADPRPSLSRGNTSTLNVALLFA